MQKELPPARLPFPVTRAAEMPAGTEGDGRMVGHFSTFGDWYRVDSHIEGTFLERIDPKAFDATIAENRDQMKVLYDHGQDPQIGNKILGRIEELRTDEKGPAYTVELFDTSYNRDLRPGLDAGVYGSSFRFSVESDQWENNARSSDYNPDGIPERTITRARVYEFGPVTFPANPAATAGTRSTTDAYYKRAKDPEQFEALVRSAQAARTPSTPAAPAQPKPQEKRSVSEYVTREEKAARKSEVESALERMSTETPGVLPAPLQAEWDALVEERQTLESDIKAWDERRAIVGDFAKKEEAVERAEAPHFIVRKSENDIYDANQLGRATRQQLRDNAMRSIESSRMEHPQADPQSMKGYMADLLDSKDSANSEIAQRMLITGSPTYKRAFNKLVAGTPLSPEESRAAALQVVGTTTTGGYMLPYTFDPTFIPTGAYTNINPLRSICRVEQIAGSNKWESVSVGAVAATYSAESAATVEGGPTFARPAATAQRATAFITLSRETLADRPDVASELSVLIDEGKATNEETQMTVGVGTTVFPQGVALAAAFTVTTTTTNDVFAVADLDKIEAALPIRHRRDAVWLWSRAVIRIIQGFETVNGKLFNSTLGYPAVGDIKNNPGGNTGMSLLGYPVYEQPSVPVTVTTDAAIIGVFFNPSQYLILDRIGMDVEIVPNMFDATTGFPTGDRGLLAIWRNTGKVLNADGGRQMKIQ